MRIVVSEPDKQSLLFIFQTNKNIKNYAYKH